MIPDPLGFGSSNEDSKKLADARSEITTLRIAVSDLQKRQERQTLLVRALFSLLTERFKLTEDELLAQFQKIEATGHDGPIKCAKCNRPINVRQNRCQFCGGSRQVSSVFDLL